MATKKKETETQNEMKTQVLMVDAKKLSQGLKTTFEGVAMVFDSIGVDADLGAVNPASDIKKAEKATEKAADAVTEKVTEKAEVQKFVEETTESDTAATAEAEATTEAPVEAVSTVAAEAPAETTTSITVDDITKIIVQKIKQNRSNNEKIGAILKTYGVSKVGELPDTKYEAFLTDLSAI